MLADFVKLQFVFRWKWGKLSFLRRVDLKLGQ